MRGPTTFLMLEAIVVGNRVNSVRYEHFVCYHGTIHFGHIGNGGHRRYPQ